MGEPTQISLRDGHYVSESPAIASQVLVGLYVNIPQTEGAISPEQLFPVPGLVEKANTGANEINRGSHTMASVPYFVNGQVLYRLESDLITATPLGTIEDAVRVSMSDNGTQLLIIVPKTRIGYIYTVAGGLVQIVDATFTDTEKAAPEIGVFLNSYFVISRGSKEFFHSNVNNGLVYDALDFTSAEADPDIIRSLLAHKNQLFVFGSETIEVYQTSQGTGAGFAFQQIVGFVIPKGIASSFGVTEFNGTFVFIGQGVEESPKIYEFTGNGVRPISTTSIDFLLQRSEADIEEVFTLAYSYRGAVFVGFSTKENGSLFYDAQSSRLAGKDIWHARLSDKLQEKTRWRVNSITTAYGQLLVGDSESGIIGVLDNDATSDYGNSIIREFGLKTLEFNSEYLTFNSIEVVLDSGQGLLNEEEPQLYMEYSDNGRTYTSPRGRGAGKQGEYNIKCKWEQLGSTNRYRIFRFSMMANVRWVILKVVIDVDS